MRTLLKQGAVVVGGLVAAAVMLWLGLWQMQAFVDSGNRGIEERAAQEPVPLESLLTADGVDGDAYGKPMTVTGVYLPDQEILLPADAGVRVLTAVELPDGRVLPVVRGIAESAAAVNPPPRGTLTQTGLLLPGEGDVPGTAPGELASVRMPRLAQEWPQQLVPGFITLNEADARRQGLTPAPVELPEGTGSFQNGGYALQWWIFAAVGLGIAVRVAVGIGRRDRALREESALADLEDRRTEERTLST
ncbi:MAG: SURF1 family protein [Propioniciclava sp.]